MNSEEPNTRKRISLAEIKPGMFVVGLDNSWLKTPFLLHRKLIKSDADIELLKRRGIREVVIDTALGADVERGHAVATETVERKVTTAAVLPEQRSPSAAELALRPLAEELPEARAVHEEALTVAKSIFEGAKGGAPVKCEMAAKVVTDLSDSIGRSPEANLFLLQMRRFEKDLFTHAVNVCVLSLVINASEALGADSSGLGLGALLHDVGETRMPRNLLRKRNQFTELERRLVEQHPRLGEKLLEQNGEMPDSARRIVLEHHERIDGSGYPNRAQGAGVSLLSQVVAIADMYDDMLSGRNQAMLPPTEVLRQLYMQSNAGALDRSLVERIIRSLGVYPIGSLVELNTGERGIVVVANRTDSLKPTVKIVTTRLGGALANGPLISLADPGANTFERRIIGALDPGKERIDPIRMMKLSAVMAQ